MDSSTPVTELAQRAIQHARDLTHAELQLAREELSEEITDVFLAIAAFALGAMLAVLATVGFVAAIVLLAGGSETLALVIAASASAVFAACALGLGYRALPKSFLMRTRTRLQRDLEYLESSQA